jgi:hypothetical protein
LRGNTRLGDNLNTVESDRSGSGTWLAVRTEWGYSLTEPQERPGVQHVDVCLFKHVRPDAQHAAPQDADWLQQLLPLHAAFVGHTCSTSYCQHAELQGCAPRSICSTWYDMSAVPQRPLCFGMNAAGLTLVSFLQRDGQGCGEQFAGCTLPPQTCTDDLGVHCPLRHTSVPLQHCCEVQQSLLAPVRRPLAAPVNPQH